MLKPAGRGAHRQAGTLNQAIEPLAQVLPQIGRGPGATQQTQAGAVLLRSRAAGRTAQRGPSAAGCAARRWASTIRSGWSRRSESGQAHQLGQAARLGQRDHLVDTVEGGGELGEAPLGDEQSRGAPRASGRRGQAGRGSSP
jgi:hypothetical protein